MSAVPQEFGLKSGAKVISIPRWLEVKDLRPKAEDIDQSRTRYYVVSPNLTPERAQALASLVAQRERLERTQASLERMQMPLVLVGFVFFIFVLIRHFNPLWYVVILGVYLIVQYMRLDAESDLSAPLNIGSLEAPGSAAMFHKISSSEFHRSNSFATKYPGRAREVHELLWRVHDLAEVLGSARQELNAMIDSDLLDGVEIEIARKKLLALEALVRDAEQALRELLSPRFPAAPLGRDRLLELFGRVDHALSEGLAHLAPRIAAEQERVRQYQASLDDMAAGAEKFGSAQDRAQDGSAASGVEDVISDDSGSVPAEPTISSPAVPSEPHVSAERHATPPFPAAPASSATPASSAARPELPRTATAYSDLEFPTLDVPAAGSTLAEGITETA